MVKPIYCSSSYDMSIESFGRNSELDTLDTAKALSKQTLESRIRTDKKGHSSIDECVLVKAPTQKTAITAEFIWKREELKVTIQTVACSILGGSLYWVGLSGTGKVITASILASYGIAAAALWVVAVAVGTLALTVFLPISYFQIYQAKEERAFWKSQVITNLQNGDDFPTRIAKARAEIFRIYEEGGSLQDLEFACYNIVSYQETILLKTEEIARSNPRLPFLDARSQAIMTLNIPEGNVATQAVFLTLLQELVQKAAQRERLSSERI